MEQGMDIEIVRKAFIDECYVLLTDSYINQMQRLEYICPNGHRRHTTWKDWKRGNRCLVCKNHSTKPNILDVRESFAREGYTLLSEKYIDNKTKLEYVCREGHKNSITWRDWNSGGYRCPDCANNKKLSLECVREEFEKEGYRLLSEIYVNNTTQLEVECPKGHKYKTSRVKWTSGNRCPVCYKERINIDSIRSSFENEGYVLLSEDYTDAHTKLDYSCKGGHIHSMSWAAWQQGERCYVCSKTGVSRAEQELFEFVKSIAPDVYARDRALIKPYELDIVVPSKKIAIEYCGLYWHSELNGKDKHYHINKLDMCNDKGYRLITIFEDEWVSKKDIVVSRLRHILGVSSAEVVYARVCSIEEITSSQAREFCDKHHIQGYTGSSVKIGTFYKNRLLAVMTFAKPSISKGGSSISNTWELSRYCSISDKRVIGAASRMLKYFERTYSWDTIFSYADRRWSNGNLYHTIGFEYGGTTAVNYWYLLPGKLERKHRFQFRKTIAEPRDITEWELRKLQGLDRIWDCGSIKYTRNNDVTL